VGAREGDVLTRRHSVRPERRTVFTGYHQLREEDKQLQEGRPDVPDYGHLYKCHPFVQVPQVQSEHNVHDADEDGGRAIESSLFRPDIPVQPLDYEEGRYQYYDVPRDKRTEYRHGRRTTEEGRWWFD